MSTIKSSAENLTLNADGANNDIIFQSNGSTKVTLDGSASGVGIGTTTPGAALEVKNTTDGTTLAFQATNDNDHEIVRIGAESNGDGYLTIHGQGASTNTKIQLHTDDVSYINGGDLSLGGDLFFTTAGKGICLGVTSNTDANTLDDYEEGTWTPTNHSGSITLSVVKATYTKIGKLVHVQAYLGTSADGDGTQMNIGGLPFANAENQYVMSIGRFSPYSTNNVYVSTVSAGSYLWVISKNTMLNENDVDGGGGDWNLNVTYNID